ncbi:glycosyltransferase [Alcaligenes sp. A-TC2]|uniref:glycosyltransferase n=1 Tax=Alcaligenes nematophilus TaxID=2994643 RepID=UPI0022577D6D|nr:glycosyltransferase [Alcaligenes nematophilus]MCX5472047.1 glycosyltransferase [Alcaligenes nematophilus]
MLQSKVSSAARAFRDEDYAKAMTLYKELGEQLGHQFFAANLALCQSRLGASVGQGELASLPAKQLRVAGVMDEFTFHSYDPECELLQLHPEHCIEQLEKFKPHILFIESAWQGFEQLWKLKISTNGPEINACIDWCKRNGVPTLFWNKEDPVHFGTFIPLAKQVDYVFTTDIDCVPKYKARVGHDHVYFLPFAAQPKTHNPLEIFDRKDAFNFAGSYYLRYPERQRDFAALIGAVKGLRSVDIYDRNADNPHPHYTFPDEYKPMILGKLPFSEIDRAYKGYRYGINMNTIKQSQTMFARRVFELLASNTVVVSNFSRGTRLLFGDLVVSSDNQEQIAERMRPIISDELHYRKLRLLGLRKVMTEHTYAQRLAYIQAKLTGKKFAIHQPLVVLLAEVKNGPEQQQILDSFQRQNYKNKQLYLVTPEGVANVEGVTCYSVLEDAFQATMSLSKDDLIGEMHADDYYGEHYLTDLALASTYTTASAFGKSAHYCARDGAPVLLGDSHQYREVDILPLRAALVRGSAWKHHQVARSWLNPGQANIQVPGMLAIDEFNYIAHGSALSDQSRAVAMDLMLLDQGVSFCNHLAAVAEGLPAFSQEDADDSSSLPQLGAKELLEWIPSKEGVTLSIVDGQIRLVSTLESGQHLYLYSRNARVRQDLNLVLNSQFHLHCEQLINIKTVFEFQDKRGKKISYQMNPAGDKHALAIPAHCTKVRFGLRIEGPGEITIEKLVLGSTAERPAAVITKSPYLVLAKQYPAYDDLYRYGFVHSRIRAYKEAGQLVDMYKIHNGPAEYREFANVDVATGDARLLEATLATGQVKHVLVHIMDQNMWKALEKYVDKIQVTVWAHGSEIQAWWRREFEFELMDDSEITRQKKLSDNRVGFWKRLFSNPPENLHVVFVSSYFAEEVFEDLKVRLPKEKYSIVHNPIDAELFDYKEKNVEQRKKVLSIRPYASKKYANDLSVQAILELSKKPIFNDLEFKLIGDGVLFEETVAPLRQFSNVDIERKFITHREIAQIHKEYGVFLTPTRMDSQGVSRDEAMASGLVPVTTAVTAIPEFVDNRSGFLVKPESATGLADAIVRMYENPEEFLEKSMEAARRVRGQCAAELIAKQELSLFVKHMSSEN